MKRTRFVVLSVCVAIFFLQGCFSFAFGITFSGFRTSAEMKWNDYFAKIDSIRCEIHHFQKIDDVEVLSNMSTFDFYNMCMATEREDSDDNSLVFGFNHAYAFRLSKSSDGQNSWRIGLLEKMREDMTGNVYEWLKSSNKNFHGAQARMIPNLATPVNLTGMLFLPELINLPEFAVSKIEQIDENAVSMYLLEYNFYPDTPDKYPFFPAHSGKVVLFEDNCLIESADIDMDFGDGEMIKMLIKNEYEHNGDISVIRKNTRNFVVDGKRHTHVTTYKIENDSFVPSRFTLSHYGFPEPNFGDRRPSPVRYALMVIGMLMIAYALWRMYKKRKETIT